MRFHEVFCLRKNSFQLKCFYKTVTIPTQNSTRAGTGNTTPALCLKKKKKWFCLTKRAWQQGHASSKKKQCGDMPGGLVGLRSNSPCAEQLRLTELFGDICSEQPPSAAEPTGAFCTGCWAQQPALPARGRRGTSSPHPLQILAGLMHCSSASYRDCYGEGVHTLSWRVLTDETDAGRTLYSLCSFVTELHPDCRSVGSPSCPPPPRGKRKTPPTYLSFCWKLSDFSVIERLFLSFINTLNRTMSALVWHTVQLTFYCNYFLGVIATVCKATNPVDYRILLIPV